MYRDIVIYYRLDNLILNKSLLTVKMTVLERKKKVKNDLKYILFGLNAVLPPYFD